MVPDPTPLTILTTDPRTMSRRQQSFSGVMWLWILLAAVILGGGGYFLLSRSPSSLRNAQELDAALYATSADSLRGNTYKVDAVVDNLLATSATGGRLISITVDGGRQVLPMVVPKEFNAINLQKQQKYNFLVKVGDKGVLSATEVKKP
jgi:hypothetical protein